MDQSTLVVGGNGSSWSAPEDNLSEALATAELTLTGANTVQIWVRATAAPYTPDRDLSGDLTPTLPRDRTFRVATGVQMFGGFDGTENFLDERDPALFRSSVLSGDMQGTPFDRSDDSYSVVFMLEPQSTAPSNPAPTIIDGFKVQLGHADGTGTQSVTGELERERGGGIYCSGTTALIRNTVLIGNIAEDAGGGMFYDGITNSIGLTGFQLLNCYAYRNRAGRGGGLATESVGDYQSLEYRQNSYVYNSVFSGNSAIVTDSAAGEGGAMWFGSRDGAIDVCNCIIDSNVAEGAGSAIFVGKDANEITLGVRIGSSTITRNSIMPPSGLGLVRGAAIYFDQTASPASSEIPLEEVKNCIVWNNFDPTNGPTIGPASLLNPASAPSMGYRVIVEFCDVDQVIPTGVVMGGPVNLGNINLDPQFMGPTNYTLSASSPCVDTGSFDKLLADLPDFDDDTLTHQEEVTADFRRLLPQFPRAISQAGVLFTAPDMGALERAPL